MRGRDLDAPRSEPDFHIVIGDNGDFPTHDRQNQRLADQMPGCLIIRVDRNGGITEHGFRAGGCHLDIAILAFDGVLDVPEEAGLLGVFDFCIRQRRGAVRAPVDDAVTAVNQSLVIEIDEHFRTAREQPSSIVKRWRVQSQEAPSFLSCPVMRAS